MYDQDNQALAHVVAQTKGNIALLVSLQKLSQYDADVFLAKLPPAADQNASLQSALTRPVPPPPLPPHPRGSTPPIKFKAKALWSWNESGKEPNDLTFTSGSVIEVIEDTNNDWWKGRYNGREGLFPSSYVEKLPPDGPAFRDNGFKQGPPPMHFPNAPPYGAPPPQRYPPPQQNYYGPPPPQGPPPGAQYPPYSGPPPPAPAQPAVANAEPPKKEGFLSGGLGNTLAHSAVGGAGFGAGSALAGGLVNSIF
ncbi:unnamed protein product [Cyclocybe aegerita]|uniref:SH3 domain-containing protein n=1 Tax=Cyclocybe aegerita TaxID=1973307 RepID=A0A8S0XWC5_CYCAE|nr:unnamed protein product [Cyclocybe aegerita]